MKFKLVYLYFILTLGVIITLFILSGKSNTTNTTGNINTSEQMPNDDVHKGLQEPSKENPSKGNVISEVYEKMSELKKDVEANPNDTSRMKAYADFMAAAHKPEDALPYYEKILKKDPKRIDILFDLAMINYNRQDYVKAENYTQRILENDKRNTQAMYNLGAIAASKGDKERAKTIWTKLVSDYPNDEVTQLARSSLEKL